MTTIVNDFVIATSSFDSASDNTIFLVEAIRGIISNIRQRT